MRNVLKLTLFVAATLLGPSASWATLVNGTTSPYYLDNAVTREIYVVQGMHVINSFPWAYSPRCISNFCEGTLAVTNVVSTNAFASFYGSYTAGQYTLSGTPTGTNWSSTPPLSGEAYNWFLDGTSDGSHNYAVEYLNPNGTQNVITTDLNWQHPAMLFTVSGAAPEDYLGTTCDPNNNSIWISGWNTDVIADYSMTGTLLSSFATGLNVMGALAFDPADGTLWFNHERSNELFQYSTSGALLQSGTLGLPNIDAYFGGEFAEPVPSDVPEPATLFLLGTGTLASA
jgi:hypothetical protein